MKTVLMAGALALFAANAAQAASAVLDTSFKDSDGHRVLRQSVVVDAPLRGAWNAFMTDEGFTRWAVPGGHVTTGNGGSMEFGFSKDFKAGDPNNVLNRIDIYLPMQMFAWHNEHVPAGGPMTPETFGQVRTVIEFVPVGEKKTRVTETVIGFGDDAKFDALYTHLKGGNAGYLTMLANNFHETAEQAAAAMQ